MARQELTVQRIDDVATIQAAGEGTTITFTAAAADGFMFENDGLTTLRVRSSGTPTVVTLPHPGTRDGLAVEDLEITLAATDEQELPFLPPGFNQEDGNLVWVNFSAVTGVTAAAVGYK